MGKDSRMSSGPGRSLEDTEADSRAEARRRPDSPKDSWNYKKWKTKTRIKEGALGQSWNEMKKMQLCKDKKEKEKSK